MAGQQIVGLITADGSTVNADISHIAAQLNKAFDIPFFPETTEQMWLEWLVGKLVRVIPPQLVSLLIDASDGLTTEEIPHHTDNLVGLLNEVIDIPMLPESVEGAIIRPFVNQLLTFAVQGKALELMPQS